MKSKYLYCILLICVFSLVGCGINNEAEKEDEIEETSNGLKFHQLNENECAVSIGDARDLNEIIIPSKYNDFIVTTIYGDSENGGFSNCTNLISIVLPDTITTIGEKAFYGCSKLCNIEIPSSVSTIGDMAFYNCLNLINIKIPSSVTNLGYSAFYNCMNLVIYCEEDEVSNGWSKNWNISKLPVFWGINSTNCYENNGIQFLLDFETKEASVLRYYAENQLVNIPNVILHNGQPYKVTTINSYAFYKCANINSIMIPESINIIENYAFKDSSISIMYCEPTDKPIGWENVSIVGVIYWGVNNTNLYKTDDFEYVLDFDKNEAKIIRYKGNKTNVIINDTIEIYGNIFAITTIGTYAFYNCYNIENIDIPSSITTIERLAFYNCSSLKFIYIPSSVKTLDWNPFYQCSNMVIYFEEKEIQNGYINFWYTDAVYVYGGINENNYIEKEKMQYVLNSETHEAILTRYVGHDKDILIPETIEHNNEFYKVTKIGDCAFAKGKNLDYVYIPDTITSIGSYAFSQCSNLNNIIIPNSVLFIGDSAFSHCSFLNNIVLSNNINILSSYIFYNCYNLKDIKIPESVVIIEDSAFIYCSSLNNVVIPNSVTSISSGAFAFCNGLERIVLSSNISSIENSTFFSCINLKYITIPENLTSIGSSAFEHCSSLECIVLPDSLITIKSYAFSNCSNLTNVKLSSSLTNIEDRTFYNCTNLINIEIPNSVEIIGAYAFYGCTKLENVVLSNSLKTIKYNAFSYCVSLKNIIIPNSVTTIERSVFEFCRNLESVIISDTVITMGKFVFDTCENLIIYCEALSIPETWDKRWNPNSRPVYWGYNIE